VTILFLNMYLVILNDFRIHVLFSRDIKTITCFKSFKTVCSLLLNYNLDLQLEMGRSDHVNC